MPRDWLLRVEDILTAIAKIESFTDGLSQDDFLSDDLDYGDSLLYRSRSSRKMDARIKSGHDGWGRVGVDEAALSQSFI